MSDRVPVSLARWWMLAALFLYSCITYIDRQLVSLLLPQIKATTQLSDTELGVIVGPAATIAFSVAIVASGWAADRFSRKLILVAGMAVFAAGTILFGIVGGMMALMFARVLVAIGEASVNPSAWSLISDGFPRSRISTAISIFGMGSKGGNTLALGLGGLLVVGIAASSLPQRFGLAPWQLGFVAIGIGFLAISPLALTFSDPGRKGAHQAKPTFGELRAYLRKDRRLLTLVMFGFAMITFASYALNSWIPAYLHRRFEMEPAVFGPILAIFGIGTSIGLGIKGVVTDWLYMRGMRDVYVRLYTWLVTGCLPLFAAMFFVESQTLFLIMYGIVMMVTIPLATYAATTLAVITPARLRGQVSALALITFSVAGGLGAVMTGVITDNVFGDDGKVGYSLAIIVFAAIPLGLLSLRLSLSPLRAAVEAAELRDADPDLDAANA